MVYFMVKCCGRRGMLGFSLGRVLKNLVLSVIVIVLMILLLFVRNLW